MICAPIFGKDEEQIGLLMERAREVCQLVELRLDLMDERVQDGLEGLIAAAPVPVIATNRASWEGGRFQGSEEARIGLIEKAIGFGARYADVEFATSEPLKQRLFQSAEREGARIILSHHDFEKTPSTGELHSLFTDMASQGDHILKIVTHARSRHDFLRLAPLYERAREEGRRLIAFCMGPKGSYSRICCIHLGSFLTFATLDEAASSAPGQIPAEVMKEVLDLLRDHC